MSMGSPIDITTIGEYAEHGEIKIVMYREQLAKLVEMLDRAAVGRAVRYDSDGAQLLSEFVETARGALHEPRD